MSRFNKTVPANLPDTENLAGAPAHAQSPELALVSLLLTSFAQDQFYRTANETFEHLKSLLGQVNPLFAAKALIYARREFGMRSITHVGASELSALVRGQQWADDFFYRIVRRPDDMQEIIAYHFSKKYKLTNAMRRGFAKALQGMDGYQLAKYRGEGKAVRMVDVVNLVHPKETQSIAALMTGNLTLDTVDTWEAALSAAGSDPEAKRKAWMHVILAGNLPYLAMLRNLRNIIDQVPNMVPDICELLVKRETIKKALIFPFQYQTAFDEVVKMPVSKERNMVIVSLQKAFELAVDNVPVFPGRTLVALDVSGSMKGKPAYIGANFAAILAKSNHADVLAFDTASWLINYNPADSLSTIHQHFKFMGGGTDFNCIFSKIKRPYDRIIVLSDMQAWVGRNVPREAFNSYKSRSGSNPKIYSFDLQGYGSLQFPEKNVYALAGFSEKIFGIMGALESDEKVLVDTIKNVQL